jgi:hypothetical protein
MNAFAIQKRSHTCAILPLKPPGDSVMLYDTWSPYDPNPHHSTEDEACIQRTIQQKRRALREMLPHLRQKIENPDRDINSVHSVLTPYYDARDGVPMALADLPGIEALCRLALDKGGLCQSHIQTALLRLIGATAAPESAPFLLEMLHYTKRGDQFGPQRRQLALWGLARIAIFHQLPGTFTALREGLDDRQAEVRLTATDLIIDVYRGTNQPVPRDLIEKLQDMADHDSDEYVRRTIERFLEEP